MVYIMICACYTWTNNWSALFHIKLHVEHFNINRVSPLLRKPWNQRVLEIKDIFGNSPKKIFSQFTGFGVEFNEFGIFDLDYLVLTLLKKIGITLTKVSQFLFLIYFSPMFYSLPRENIRKPSNFLTFLGGIAMKYWHAMN